jgi:hypothetical protein
MVRKKKLAAARQSNDQQNGGFEINQEHPTTSPPKNQVSLRPIDKTATRELRSQDGKKVVASIRGACLYQRRKARTSVHRLTNSWAIGTHILDRARVLDVERVEITDPETGKVYTAPLEAFWGEHSVAIDYVEPQRGLPLRYWTVTDGRL